MITDYSKYASMVGNKEQMSFKTFNIIKVSGKVDRETLEGGLEKKKDAVAVYTDMKNKQGDSKAPTSELPLPIKLIPLKLRSILEARSSNGETVVMYSTEYNNGGDDMVTITDKNDGDKKYRMTVKEARKKFTSPDGKSLLRQSYRLYSLYHNGESYEVVRFNITGSAVWEAPDAPTKELSISEYLSTFTPSEPSFLFNMNVGFVYRPKKATKVEYNRATFSRGERITPEVEEIVLRELEDIHKYCEEVDKIEPSTKMSDSEVNAVNTEVSSAESVSSNVDEDESPF